MSKDFLDRVKANQEKTAAVTPLPVVTIKVMMMNDNSVMVERPAGDTPVQLAWVIKLLNAGINIVNDKIIEGGDSRIVVPPPGARIQG